MEDNLFKDLENLKINHTKAKSSTISRNLIIILLAAGLLIVVALFFIRKSLTSNKQVIVDKIKAILIAFRFIGWVTIISTFLLVANCIAISIRERTTEIGVMRVLGFSRAKILILVLAESMGVAVCGGMVGALLAYLLPTMYHIEIPATVPLHVDPDFRLVAYGFLISIMIGFLGGIFPSLSSVLMKPSDTIRGIG